MYSITFGLGEVRDPTECVSDGRDDLMVHVQHVQAVNGERRVVQEEPVQQHKSLSKGVNAWTRPRLNTDYVLLLTFDTQPLSV